MKDGTRKIINITEVVGMEGDIITLQDIFCYKIEGMDASGKLKGSFLATGIRPSFADKVAEMGIMMRDDWFSN